MSESRRVHLHLGKCIEDLDKMYSVPDLKAKKIKLLCKSAEKVLENADQARERGDEEHSYVFYMKYLRIIAYISKDQEYQRDKKYYTDMLGPKNPNKAINAAEELKISLIERYAKEQKLKCLNEIKETELIKHTIDEHRKKAIENVITEPSLPYQLPDLEEVTIKSDTLFAILKTGKLKVMILDARPGKDFIESHINHQSCISVPEECISPGQSANILEQSLPPPSRPVWAERASTDLIVMLDWTSSTFIPGKTLHLLRTILLKWDVKVRYPRAPLALHRGYEEWLLRYPQLTTNPHALPPTQQDTLDDMLGDIEYPNWSDYSASPAPSVNRVSKPNEPVIDRASKAAAVQMYEERTRHMSSILEKQATIADTSLKIETERINAEQDWKKIREKQATELEEHLQQKYQLREQEITSQLMQLENKQYDMEQENQSLRQQLEDYRRREKEEAALLAQSLAAAEQSASDGAAEARVHHQQQELACKQARIDEVQSRRHALHRRREALEMERKRAERQVRLSKDEEEDHHMVSPGDSPGATGLNRSQSSPNIAKSATLLKLVVTVAVQAASLPADAIHLGHGIISSDEDEVSAPSFDRSTKPLSKVAPPSDMQKQRDFQPVWGNVGRGLTGLKNLGNTCYMNSIIQCLNNTNILYNYFINGNYQEHVNRSHGTRGAIAEELAAVVRALWSGQYRFIAIKDLRNEVGKHQRAFRGCEQQDSHEFLTILMDWLHDDLQFYNKGPNKESLQPSEKAWQEYTKSKESLILRLFYGQIRSTVRCVVCGSQSVTYESFSNLSLELPHNAPRCTLQDCLQLYLKGETIPGWNCPNCKEKRDAVKKLDISRLPPVLVIHFKRFYVDPKEYMVNAYRKKQTYIDFQLEDLDMRQFSLHCPGNSSYSLYAVSNHYGSMEGGHYTAYCKSANYNKWYKYDDHVVSEISRGDVKSSAAYILFYSNTSARA